MIADASTRAKDPATMAYGIHEASHNEVAALVDAYLEQAQTPRTASSPEGNYLVPHDSRLLARITSATAEAVRSKADDEARMNLAGGSVSVYQPSTVALARKFATGNPGAPELFQSMRVSGPDGTPRYFPALSQDAIRFMLAVRDDQQRSAKLQSAAKEHEARMESLASSPRRFSL